MAHKEVKKTVRYLPTIILVQSNQNYLSKCSHTSNTIVNYATFSIAREAFAWLPHYYISIKIRKQILQCANLNIYSINIICIIHYLLPNALFVLQEQ